MPALPLADVVEERLRLGAREVRLARPRDGDALLDELLREDDPDEDRLPFWAELWPSGVALARAVSGRPLAGKRVLELGCGLGLVSVAAAAAGASVVAVDRCPEAAAFTAENATRNGLRLRTAVRSFADPGDLLTQSPWDLVLAADVLYDAANVPTLLWLLPRLVAPTGEVWLADPQRRPAATFLTATDAAGWHRDQLPTDPPVVIHRLRPGSAAPPLKTVR